MDGTTHRRLLTPEEAAQALGVGRSFLYDLVRQGRIETLKLGKLRRIPAAAVDDFVARERAAQAAG